MHLLSELSLAIFRFCDEWRHQVSESDIGSELSTSTWCMIQSANFEATSTQVAEILSVTK